MMIDLTREEYLYIITLLETLDHQFKNNNVLPINIRQMRSVNDSLLKKLKGK